jgi:putative hydrolase of the HAD superfamily
MTGPAASPSRVPSRVVVFDIDDTLYLERDYVRSGFRAVGAWARRTLGVPDLADRAWAAFESGVRATIFDAALGGVGIEATPELMARLVACYREHQPDITLLSDSRACLEALDTDRDAAVAVITDGPLASQSAKARSLGLATWSQTVIYTEALGAGFGKPHHRAFEQVEDRLGMPGDRCTYIADNPAKDFVAPRARGWATIRVRRPRALHYDVDGGDDIDHELADMTDVMTLIGRREALR